MKSVMRTSLTLLVLLVAASHAGASEDEFDIDPGNRAKIAKEKVRQGAKLREAQKLGNSTGSTGSDDCGSQNIGNIDTEGRRGAAPREVFIFAPNAINLVQSGGCR